MSREELAKQKKENEEADVTRSKPPYKTTTEGQLYVVNQMMNPPKERYPEFTNMKGSDVFGIVMGMVRERAADPTRNRLTEPLSEIMRIAYCQCQRGVGFKMAMLAGNVGLGMKSGDSEGDMPMPRNRTNF